MSRKANVKAPPTMENEGAAAANAETQTPETETLINAFCEITSSSSKSAALFFLESHNFNLDSAVSTFLEENTTTTTPLPSSAVSAVEVSGNTSNLPESPSDTEKSYSPSNSETSSRSPSPPRPSKRQRNSSTAYNLRSSRVARVAESGGGGGRRSGAIRSLKRGRSTTGSGSDSDDTQEYYTGGEKSGMLVQDPSKANDIDAIFDQARRHAAVEGPLEHLPSPSSRSFTGTARRLTDEAESSVPQPPENVTHTITFWSNGFTVDDGPLRRFNDPENASFLQSIRKSECPKELEPVDKKTSVRVNLTRREEKCPVPGKRHAPFQGKGRTLGGASNAVPVESTVAVLSLTAAPAPSVGLVVDQTQPSTSIQIRLADGTRMVSRFNYQHTIRDIRGFIDASRPGAPRSYQLQTVGFPPKQLADLDQTIEQASLANSVVIQKL